MCTESRVGGQRVGLGGSERCGSQSLLFHGGLLAEFGPVTRRIVVRVKWRKGKRCKPLWVPLWREKRSINEVKAYINKSTLNLSPICSMGEVGLFFVVLGQRCWFPVPFKLRFPRSACTLPPLACKDQYTRARTINVPRNLLCPQYTQEKNWQVSFLSSSHTTAATTCWPIRLFGIRF